MLVERQLGLHVWLQLTAARSPTRKSLQLA